MVIMPLTLVQLQAVMPQAGIRARTYLTPLVDTMDRFGITDGVDQASFLAQVAHESGQLHFTAEIWGPTPAQLGYEGREDLGNVQPGDGERYRGRGFLQITGRSNYAACARGLGIDCVTDPDLLAHPPHAATSAGWFWQTHGLSALAGNFVAVTKRINGGLNGYVNRLCFYERALLALGVASK